MQTRATIASVVTVARRALDATVAAVESCVHAVATVIAPNGLKSKPAQKAWSRGHHDAFTYSSKLARHTQVHLFCRIQTARGFIQLMERMGTETEALLREFSQSGSETAFQKLVSRYINLVYSVACRRTGGDSHLAEDVAQTVFTDLARKARSLPRDVMLGGWLHRHTCFVASTIMRTNRRRIEREQQAVIMSALTESSNDDWKDLAPVLDEAINDLEKTDRAAIVLRFFEERDLRSIAHVLAVSEDAAQKRVARALDKLRDLLVKRGVALAVPALAGTLASNSVSAAPAGMAKSISESALAKAAVPAGLLAGLFAWLTPSVLKPALISLALLGLVSAVLWPRLRPATTSNPAAQPKSVPGVPSATKQSDAIASVEPADAVAPTSNVLRLLIVAADSGRPIPNVPLSVHLYRPEFSRQTMVANREGVCNIKLDRDNTTQIHITTRLDGFADTRLHWRPDRGEQIPQNYTLRLIRPASIGGRVLDADGRPVPGAKVGWNHREDPTSKTSPESHDFTWIEVSTDEEGRWRINRIAPEMLRQIYGGANHPEHAGTRLIFVGDDPQAEKALRDETHIFSLGRAATVTGMVVDPDEQPVAGAKVRVGGIGEVDAREGITAADGSFTLAGCKLGDTTLSAEAHGFGVNTLPVNITTNSPSFHVQLKAGRQLTLRAVDQNGAPIPKARVWLNTHPAVRLSTNKPPQVEFTQSADDNGIMIWNSAPKGDLTFKVSQRGYMDSGDVHVRADETDKTVVLLPPLEISGTVQDESGQPIPRFRLICGSPQRDGQQRIVGTSWSMVERHWLNFSGGEFRHLLEEAIVGGMPNPGYQFKIEAEGYAPFISRVVEPSESKVRLDATLHRSTAVIVTARLPNGQPAVKADVGLVAPGAFFELVPGGFSRTAVQDLTALLRTDARGQFQFHTAPARERIIVAHRQGYGEATPETLAREPMIQLQPWGRVEGTYRINGQPVPGRALNVDLAKGSHNTVRCGASFEVQTDSQGRFVFPMVPPGRLKLMEWVPSQSGGQTVRTGFSQKEVSVDPGETVRVDLGGNTCRVTANVRMAEDLQLPPSTHTHYFLWPQVWNNPEQPLAKESVAHAYELTSNPDGTWTGKEVAPGQYVFQVRVVAPQNGTLLASGRSSVVIDIPAEPSNTPLDLGEVVVTSAQGPP
jgi:RNA polymerase sigma factor (sigma-70 family)